MCVPAVGGGRVVGWCLISSINWKTAYGGYGGGGKVALLKEATPSNHRSRRRLYYEYEYEYLYHYLLTYYTYYSSKLLNWLYISHPSYYTIDIILVHMRSYYHMYMHWKYNIFRSFLIHSVRFTPTSFNDIFVNVLFENGEKY